MEHNLIPPFIIREARINISIMPKIHVKDLSIEEDHLIYFQETSLRILLSLVGVFSYFPSCMPLDSTLQGSEDVYLLMPTCWDPHSPAHAMNGESMLDWEGNMTQRRF